MAITRNHPAEYTHWQPESVKIINGQPVRFRDVVVHEIRMGDVEDPEIYAAQPLYEWELSEHGQWVMSHSLSPPLFHIKSNHEWLGYKLMIEAELTDEDTTYHSLKWGSNATRCSQ